VRAAVAVGRGRPPPRGPAAAGGAAAPTPPGPAHGAPPPAAATSTPEMGAARSWSPGVICCRRGTAEITAAVGRCLDRPVPPTRPRRHTQVWRPYRARGADDLAHRRYGNDHYQYLGRLPGSRGPTHIIAPTSHGLARASSQRDEKEKSQRLQTVIFPIRVGPLSERMTRTGDATSSETGDDALGPCRQDWSQLVA